MRDEKDFSAAFARIAARVLVAAGVGTASGMTIVGGCVPADCGEYDDASVQRNATQVNEAEVATELARFEGENPEATPREKLEHLYGSMSGQGMFSAFSHYGDSALALLGQVAAANGGSIDTDLCDTFCGLGGVSSCRMGSDKDTEQAILLCSGADKSGCIGGRAPAGLAAVDAARGSDERGAWWAWIAHLESCAVHAFASLHAELVHHGAPQALTEGALRAMHEEIVHVGLTCAQAERFGGLVQAPIVERPAPRTMLEIARENAAEGCVREAFGALEMLLWAERAADPEVARTLARIGRDETGHAALSWAIDAWLHEQLDPTERAAVDAARRAAFAELRGEVARRGDAALGDTAMSCALEAGAILDAMERELLAA